MIVHVPNEISPVELITFGFTLDLVVHSMCFLQVLNSEQNAFRPSPNAERISPDVSCVLNVVRCVVYHI